ncbi:MAG: hypothetical protein HKO63_07280 [Acidimicrobiia bacterium]|nr:hypothetical protein [Acidimicrobiia bacterium]NNF87139.1 hypothetical protein [Acidimicrobiia bacterium]NNL97990.1 hypothetical protein [Acidimicrobiia bacterium]
MLVRAYTRLSTAPSYQTFLVVFMPVLALYLLTMQRADVESNFDAVAAAMPAWRMAQFGDLDLAQFEQLPFIFDVGGSVVSNRPPGISFLSVPLYWLFGSSTFTGAVPSLLPATATAAIASAGAVGVLHLVLRRLATPLAAIGGALVFAAGTSTWSISANELWPHGPAQLFLALGVLGLAGERFFGGGLAYGAALLIRPVTAIIPAVTGLWHGWKTRTWWPIVWVGLGSLIGLAALLLYNQAVLNTWSPAPPSYGESFVNRAGRQSLFAYVGDVLGLLFHPKYSVFVFSPFLLFTIPGLRTAWRTAPTWTKSSAVGGLAYILIHLRLNRFWGGLAFNYRYALELLIVLSPLLFLSWQAWYEGASPFGRRLFWYSVGASAGIQAIAISISFKNGYLL